MKVSNDARFQCSFKLREISNKFSYKYYSIWVENLFNSIQAQYCSLELTDDEVYSFTQDMLHVTTELLQAKTLPVVLDHSKIDSLVNGVYNARLFLDSLTDLLRDVESKVTKAFYINN